MNVSMMDSYNLAWKLIYSINGLTPHSEGQTEDILDTYHTERHTIAQELIEFDRAFSSMFSGKIGAPEDGAGGLTHEEFLKVFSRGNGFTSGCGIEYPENMTVNRRLKEDNNPIHGTDYLSGVLRPGRRLLNVRVIRHADGYRRDIQDGELYNWFSCQCKANLRPRLSFYRSFPHSLPHVFRPAQPAGYLCADIETAVTVNRSLSAIIG
jgi:hypothetical protein